MKPNLVGIYAGIVSPEFIAHRDRKAPSYNAGIFGADAEFPEYHQVEIDPMQTLFEGWEYDTDHSVLHLALDYKMYSQDGIHVSKPIQRAIKKGKTDALVIWRWLPEYKELQAWMQVKYEILGIVDAKEALKKLNAKNRFTFKLV